MRLLGTKSLKLEEFFEDKIPFYAILSHTWEGSEVSFQDLQTGDAEKKSGYDKLRRCCAIAAADGFDYVWIDTCCINTTSSAELSEAINSMYRWYRQAEVCYAYLADVAPGDDPHTAGSDFARSRWFTRGWTLQELLAPESVNFFNRCWSEIGTKSSLAHIITGITRIHSEALMGNETKIRSFSIAQRMSWAARRQTSRTEDMAYCLLGIFDINMPMLYGEGDRAFIRLQEEILRTSDDPTIFAWERDKVEYLDNLESGLLADTPRHFQSSHNIVRSHDQNTMSFTLTNRGIHIRLRAISTSVYGIMFGVLDCHRSNGQQPRYSIYLKTNRQSDFSCRYHGMITLLNETRISIFRTISTYVKQPPKIGNSLTPYWRYRIIANDVQEWYPSELKLPDGSLCGPVALFDDLTAVKFGAYSKSFVVVRRNSLVGRFYAEIVAVDPEESLEDIVKSFGDEAKTWLPQTDRLVQEVAPGESISVSFRKQIVSGVRWLTIGITST